MTSCDSPTMIFVGGTGVSPATPSFIVLVQQLTSVTCHLRPDLLHRLRQILPSDQHESLVFQEFLKLGALYHVEIVLPPRGAPVGVVGGCAAHLVVVVGEVQDDL